MNKKCELCDSKANTYCESDDANLCWSCDAIVHSANFIVQKHSRTLLCYICQSLTPWSASGRNLAPTLSLCHFCTRDQSTPSNRDDDDDFDDDGDDGDDGDDDGENQVVPLSPPPVSGSSRSGGSCGGKKLSAMVSSLF